MIEDDAPVHQDLAFRDNRRHDHIAQAVAQGQEHADDGAVAFGHCGKALFEVVNLLLYKCG